MSKRETHELREARYTIKRLQGMLTRRAARAEKLEAAIREHHRQVMEQDNWGADDVLWATLALAGRPEQKAA
jgi:hypothetical protein